MSPLRLLEYQAHDEAQLQAGWRVGFLIFPKLHRLEGEGGRVSSHVCHKGCSDTKA